MKANVLDSYVAGALKLISPNLARYYLMHDTLRRFLNFGILYFVTYWTTVPMTVAFALGLGATPLAWVLSGFFVGTLVAGFRFLFSNYWIWKEGKEQGQSRGEQLPTTSVSTADPLLHSGTSPTPIQEKVVECSTCNGRGTIGDNLCTRCRGHGKIRIVPRGSMPTIGGKPKSNWKTLPPQGFMLLGIVFGLLIVVIGSKIPLVGNYIALGGVGIILVSVYMFKPSSEKTTRTKPDASST